MQMKVKIHEALVKKVQAGQQAEIRIDAHSGGVLRGTVQSVATLAASEGWIDRFVKEYETIVKIDNLPIEAGLKPGFTGEVKILANELSNVLLVPVQAVGQLGGKHYCYVSTAQSVDRREVVVGENNDKFVEIKEGLEEGDKVALDARSRLAAEAKSRDAVPEQSTAPEKMNMMPRLKRKRRLFANASGSASSRTG
jgi:multidrug efflux pump subunit AcrA (membrane-fusion protein)